MMIGSIVAFIGFHSLFSKEFRVHHPKHNPNNDNNDIDKKFYQFPLIHLLGASLSLGEVVVASGGKI